MAAVAKLTIKNKFADDTTQTISIDNLNPEIIASAEAITNIKTKVKNFNGTNGGTLATKMVSKNGFNWVAVTDVTITITDKTYIF